MSMEKALALAALAKAGQGGGGGDVSFATDAEVKAGTASDKALAPSNESAASFYGLAKAAGDNTQAASSNPVGTYTAEAKIAIKSMLGVSGGETWELINTIEPTEEVATVSFTADANGNPFSLKKAILLGNVPKYEGTASIGTFCYAYVNNQKGLVYTYMSRPLTNNRTSFVYEIYAACNGLPYREVLKYTSVSGSESSCGASNNNTLFDCYSIDPNKQPTAISEVSVRTGNGDVVAYAGCKYFLYGVRA